MPLLKAKDTSGQIEGILSTNQAVHVRSQVDGITATVHTAVGADVDAAVSANGVRLHGWSVQATTATSGTVRITDGATGAAGLALGYVNVASGTTETQWFDRGITAGVNISIQKIDGTCDVTLYHTTGNS